jgi:hypothetical protein
VAVVSRRALRAPETFDAWLDAFGRAVSVAPSGDLPPCPNCGRFDLELRFVADAATRIGFAALWSRFCQHGIRVSRVEVPGNASFLPLDAPEAVLRDYIPDFVELGPSGPAIAAEGLDLRGRVLRLVSRQGPLSLPQIASEIGDSSVSVAAALDDAVARGLLIRTASGTFDLAEQEALGAQRTAAFPVQPIAEAAATGSLGRSVHPAT